MPSGVWQMRLCLREWKRNPGASEDAGELHLQLPERSAGDEGLVSSSATGYRGVWSRAESDQELEDPYHVHQEVQTHNDSILINVIAFILKISMGWKVICKLKFSCLAIHILFIMKCS